MSDRIILWIGSTKVIRLKVKIWRKMFVTSIKSSLVSCKDKYVFHKF